MFRLNLRTQVVHRHPLCERAERLAYGNWADVTVPPRGTRRCRLCANR